MVEVLVVIFMVEVALDELISVAIVFKIFFICNFICSFFIRSFSLLNNASQSDWLFSTSFFSGVFSQVKDDRLMLVAQPHSTRIMAVIQKRCGIDL